MSAFRNIIDELENKDIYIFLDNATHKAKITDVVDDIAKVTLFDVNSGEPSELTMHVNNVILISNVAG